MTLIGWLFGLKNTGHKKKICIYMKEDTHSMTTVVLCLIIILKLVIVGKIVRYNAIELQIYNVKYKYHI